MDWADRIEEQRDREEPGWREERERNSRWHAASSSIRLLLDRPPNAKHAASFRKHFNDACECSSFKVNHEMLYRSAAERLEQLDELEFGGRKIRVRVDRGPTAPKAKKERAPREQRPRRERVPDEDKVVEPTKVFVMNLNFDTTEDELADHCASYGSVVAAELLTRGRNNRPSGSAIVEYSADHEAKAAIAGLEGQELGGRPLRVREYYSA